MSNGVNLSLDVSIFLTSHRQATDKPPTSHHTDYLILVVSPF